MPDGRSQVSVELSTKLFLCDSSFETTKLGAFPRKDKTFEELVKEDLIK